MNALDASALNSIETLYNECKKKKITLILSHVNEQPMHVMKKSGFYDKVRPENFCEHIDDALLRAEALA